MHTKRFSHNSGCDQIAYIKFITGKLKCLHHPSRYGDHHNEIVTTKSNEDINVYIAAAEWDLFHNDEFLKVARNLTEKIPEKDNST
jgi:hypothetical protein